MTTALTRNSIPLDLPGLSADPHKPDNDAQAPANRPAQNDHYEPPEEVGIIGRSPVIAADNARQAARDPLLSPPSGPRQHFRGPDGGLMLVWQGWFSRRQ